MLNDGTRDDFLLHSLDLRFCFRFYFLLHLAYEHTHHTHRHTERDSTDDIPINHACFHFNMTCRDRRMATFSHPCRYCVRLNVARARMCVMHAMEKTESMFRHIFFVPSLHTRFAGTHIFFFTFYFRFP